MNEDCKMVLYNENEEPEEFEYLGHLDVAGQEYVVLCLDDDCEDVEAIIMRRDIIIEDGEEKESFSLVDDEGTFDMVYACFEEAYADVYDFGE